MCQAVRLTLVSIFRGIESLKALLPFYDSGIGTFYDLRHFTMQTAPKVNQACVTDCFLVVQSVFMQRARWDYHSTHVNQLLTLLTIQHDVQLEETAER